ncbi:MAG: MoaD family protein [Euryarchaeota archaeon]|nr:MoaD family protein [Euryarchaeota archaeon]
MVTVRLFAVFREVVGQKEVKIPAKNVQELIKSLSSKHEKIVPFLTKSTDPFVLEENIILVNGRSISFLDGLKTELKDKDVVSIFPPIGGG